MSSAIAELMQQAVACSVFPGASLWVGTPKEILFQEHFGDAIGNTDEPKLFDIASLTKPVCTATLCMLLSEEEKLDSGLLRNDMAEIEALLSHTSGLPAWKPYYLEIPAEEIGSEKAKQYILNAIRNEPRLSKIGVLCEYSDLGYILLGDLLEKTTGKPLDKLFQEKIANPLGLRQTRFGPVANALPTEYCPWRKKVVQGTVHDQNAFAMGGVAGHAGLFSTTDDLHIFMKALTAAARGESSWLRQKTACAFLDFETRHGTFVLGWDTPTFGTSSSGRYFSPHSIGHLGFTGCSIWCDLDRNFWVILLTNRTYPSSTNNKIKTFRPRLHNLVWQEILRHV